MSSAVGALLDWAGSYLDLQQSDGLAVPATASTPGAKVCIRVLSPRQAISLILEPLYIILSIILL